MTGMSGTLTAGQAGTAAERRCRVLIGDEEILIRELLVRVLEKAWHRCRYRRRRPFHLGELVARVRARLRTAARTAPGTVASGRLRLDIVHKRERGFASPARCSYSLVGPGLGMFPVPAR
jgi:hypothetical protein